MWRRILIATTLCCTLVLAGVAIQAHRNAIARQQAPPTAVAQAPQGRVFLSTGQALQAQKTGLWPERPRSLLTVGRAMSFGEWRWDESGVPAGRPSVRIDLSTQIISVLRGGDEIGTAVVLYGGDGHPTPLGRFPILAKSADYHSRNYDADMPFALRLTADGVALHGSDVLSGRATHGCIGLPLPFARKLFETMRRDDIVMIVRSQRDKYS